ncbi:TIGR04063 family PEP-CTERM/XrtA system glycosyltransferase [uncultured Thiodictyon sp.]|uniref:TIGR04063 family PEP-CTERM/XrtA system glycosyltransferase n=1 Tax=uncultured Thiodictyon sp. TaxID=1846217 RepID=UPI0025F2675F|nr:TIGR04063 family PEP-CTERM/XrtA system glycosyltransferase [uncultured Thiodictyon sp.]
MKILHVLDHSIPLHSGYTFRTRAILEHQRALGWETVQVTSAKHHGADAAVEVVDGLEFYRTAAGPGLFSGLPIVNQWDVIRGLERRLIQVIERERPDLLHAHSPSLNAVAAIRAGRRCALPVVYECRAFWEDAATDHGTNSSWGPRYRLSRRLETWAFRHCDAVTCICEGLRADICARGIPASKVTVIPNGVDLARFEYGLSRDPALATELGLTDHVVFGFLGSFYAYEGLSLALRALPLIIREAPRIRLLLVGGGPQESELKRLTSELGLDSYVIFSGRVPHEQVERYYRLVDVLLYPRLPMRLTDLVTPLKPLEAMAQGILVMASDVGGHRELIRHGETGTLFPAGNAQSLASAVLDLLSRRDAWARLRRRARAAVERERGWPLSVERYRCVYDGLLLSRAPRHAVRAG